MLLFEVDLVVDMDDETEDAIVDAVFDDEEEPVRLAQEAAAVVDTQMIEKAARDTVALFDDGFQISDIFKGFQHLMDAADVLEGTTEDEKKELVVKGARRAYELLDPDISGWIPQWVERKFINYALDMVIPHAYDWGRDLMKDKSED